MRFVCTLLWFSTPRTPTPMTRPRPLPAQHTFPGFESNLHVTLKDLKVDILVLTLVTLGMIYCVTDLC